MHDAIFYEQVQMENEKDTLMKKEAEHVRTIHDLLNYSIKHKNMGNVLLIEFLLREKAVITLQDPIETLDLYYKPNNHKRLNTLLNEYVASGKSIYLKSY